MSEVLNFIEKVKKENREKLAFFEVLLNDRFEWDNKDTARKIVNINEVVKHNRDRSEELSLLGLFDLLDKQNVLMNAIVASIFSKIDGEERKKIFRRGINEMIEKIREEYKRLLLIEKNFKKERVS